MDFQFLSIVSLFLLNHTYYPHSPISFNFCLLFHHEELFEEALSDYRLSLSIFVYCFSIPCSCGSVSRAMSFQFLSIVSVYMRSRRQPYPPPFNFCLLFRRLGRWGWSARYWWTLSIFVYCFIKTILRYYGIAKDTFNFCLLFRSLLSLIPVAGALLVLSIFVYCFSKKSCSILLTNLLLSIFVYCFSDIIPTTVRQEVYCDTFNFCLLFHTIHYSWWIWSRISVYFQFLSIVSGFCCFFGCLYVCYCF